MSLLAQPTMQAAAGPREGLAAFFPIQLHHPTDATRPAPASLRRGASGGPRWGLILAGGDGTRLRGLTHLICGDDRPKQFCKVFGRETLLEQTQQRAARSIPAGQTIIALTENHKRFYEGIPGISLSRRLVQPCNRGTAPPIIWGLLNIAIQAPGAMVAILPSDHYFSDEAAFTASLESAFEIAGAHPDHVLLLGAQPKSPEVEFGWINLGPAAGENVFRVRGFEEKPNLEVAEHLLESGALWNTFVMVGSATAFLWMSFVSLPVLLTMLNESLPFYKGYGDLRVPSSLYEAIPTTDYSRQVLTPNAHRLLALRLQQQMEWYDLGQPDRVVSVVRSRSEEIPAWIHAWESTHRAARGAIFQP